MGFLQEYTAKRFEFMEREQALLFAEYLHQIGVWYWDHNVMGQVEKNFISNYVGYDIKSMCKLVKLIGNNYVKSPEFLSLVENTLKMRLTYLVKKSEASSEHFDGACVRDLTDGLSAMGDPIGTKPLFNILKTMLLLASREGRNLV